MGSFTVREKCKQLIWIVISQTNFDRPLLAESGRSNYSDFAHSSVRFGE
jgi:hypothetical protein